MRFVAQRIWIAAVDSVRGNSLATRIPLGKLDTLALINKGRRTVTSQVNAGSTESDYKKYGYSERTLEMLESEEGQLNAIFACYGSAVQNGQLFEESLAKLVAILNEWSEADNPTEGLERDLT